MRIRYIGRKSKPEYLPNFDIKANYTAQRGTVIASPMPLLDDASFAAICHADLLPASDMLRKIASLKDDRREFYTARYEHLQQSASWLS
jgi:hypothetical protein